MVATPKKHEAETEKVTEDAVAPSSYASTEEYSAKSIESGNARAMRQDVLDALADMDIEDRWSRGKSMGFILASSCGLWALLIFAVNII